MARRKKKKNFKVVFLLISIIIVLSIFYVTRPEFQLKQKGYAEIIVSAILEKEDKVVNSVLKVEYKDYILELINDKNYDYKLVRDYTLYYEDNEGIKIKDVVSIVNDDKTKVENVTKFASDPYFIYERLTRYLDYYNTNSNVTTSEVLRTINTNTDYDFYTNTSNVDLTKATLLLVNKYYKLDESYVPSDLVDVDSNYGTGKLNKDAYQHLVMMADAMQTEGLSIYAGSNYRSYTTQSNLYNNYVTSYGEEYANTFSARAGFSEHQTGLAMDISANNGGIDKFENSDEFAWVKDHAHLYGFILRYPENKENLTGYKYEPWHYRYVGTDVAKYIYENNITFDEYYAYFIGR